MAQNEAKPAAAPEVASARQNEERQEELEKAVGWLNATAQTIPSEVRFSIHQETHQIVVRVVDGNGKVIREVPPERILDAYAKMAKLFGLMLDQSA
ncbi:MAG: flagellar protein FlaG [Chloroflexota bacterium]